MLVFLSLFGLTFLGCYEEDPPASANGVYRTGGGLDDTDNDGDGFSELDGDCDDTRDDVYPGAYEICWDDDPNLPPGKLLPIDKNCDGDEFKDAIDAFTAFPDNDGDGFGWAEGEQSVCFLNTGFVENGEDCDDTVAAIHPDAKENCDAVDNDCNGLVDDDPDIGGSVYFEDSDGDGFGNVEVFAVACPDFSPSTYVANSGDCDDADESINPAATEVCDGGIDNDCSGLADEEEMPIASLPQWYTDDDGDAWGGDWATAACAAPGDAFSNTPGDCNDSDESIHPLAVEVCDGINNDCDLAIDEDVTSTFYADADLDSFGDPATAVEACEAPDGYTTDNDDCNDDDSAVYPGATEVVGDEIDSDCDDGEVCYLDADDDGVTDGMGATVVSADVDCQDSTETTGMEGDDCDDASALVGSMTTDADCDGTVTSEDCDDDNEDSTTMATDADCDGAITDLDCDDEDATVTAAADDADCDGVLTADDCDDDDDTLLASENDADCDRALTEDDCDDDDDTSTTVALDGDCDGVLTDFDCNDDDDTLLASADDADCDGYLTSEDCNDSDTAIFPGATEIMDSPVDENCDGYAAITCEGDRNDADAEGCGIVTGELSVRFTDWTDMSLLVALEEVDLLEIYENNSLLDLDDLAGLRTAGTIMIYANDVLNDVNGLNGLTSIDQLDINGNDDLVSIDLFNEGSDVTEMDSLKIISTNITELNAFNAITTIHSQLRIAFNHAITDISGLQNLETIDNVDPGCDFFELGCYEPLFMIQNHSALTDVSGFSKLERVQTTLSIQDNPALTDISGFAALTQVDDYVYINSNNNLTDISGFDVLDTVGRYVSIDNNDALIDIAGFNALETGGVWIQRENLLEDVSGFASLTTISSDGLLIQYNPALISFAGLANVTSAVGQIGIVDNDSLTDLDGLAGVTSVSSTQVRLNDSLCQSIVDDYVAGITYDTLGTVTGNLDGC